ncbi:hypothetical protein C8R45DRAFT_1030185 [Mycena sanguinolenta]|nr:hypothetical protein C8R45DRAFT_1030185 [Mycena sanguinolenta]
MAPSETTTTPLSPTPVSNSNPSSDDSNTGASQRSTSVIAIVGAIVGAIILIVLVFLFVMLYRRRRARSAATGTISVFDLLDDNSQGQLSSQNSIQTTLQTPLQPAPAQSFSDSSPLPARPRALPTPPMSQHGRIVDATQTKPQTEMHSMAITAGASGTGANLRGGAQMFDVTSGTGSRYHSTQSSVSSYADPRSELTIHIPMTSFRPSHSPSTSNSHSHSHSFSNSPRPGHSHSYTNSQSHGHSPITRNGVPMPPEEADIVRGIVLGSLAVVDTASIRAYSPTVETEADDDDDLWAPPVMHVDSGIRISRALMELPPQYVAA